jgi:hypothetical protein
MPEEPPSEGQPGAHIRASLHELSQVLREAHHLEPEAQEALADLVDELGKALTPAALASSETAHLASSAANVARALHQQHNPTLLSAAKRRLEQAALQAETKAPVATGVARRILDVLADLGI